MTSDTQTVLLGSPGIKNGLGWGRCGRGQEVDDAAETPMQDVGGDGLARVGGKPRVGNARHERVARQKAGHDLRHIAGRLRARLEARKRGLEARGLVGGRGTSLGPCAHEGRDTRHSPLGVARHAHEHGSGRVRASGLTRCIHRVGRAVCRPRRTFHADMRAELARRAERKGRKRVVGNKDRPVRTGLARKSAQVAGTHGGTAQHGGNADLAAKRRKLGGKRLHRGRGVACPRMGRARDPKGRTRGRGRCCGGFGAVRQGRAPGRGGSRRRVPRTPRHPRGSPHGTSWWRRGNARRSDSRRRR